jgi:hypothetical protein
VENQWWFGSLKEQKRPRISDKGNKLQEEELCRGPIRRKFLRERAQVALCAIELASQRITCPNEAPLSGAVRRRIRSDQVYSRAPNRIKIFSIR